MSDTTDEAQTVGNKKTTPSSSIVPLIVMMLALSCMGGVVGAWSFKQVSSPMQTSSSKIVVLRASDYLASANGGDSFDSEAASKAISKMKSDARALANQGYIVLDESAIIAAAPEKIYHGSDSSQSRSR